VLTTITSVRPFFLFLFEPCFVALRNDQPIRSIINQPRGMFPNSTFSTSNDNWSIIPNRLYLLHHTSVFLLAFRSISPGSSSRRHQQRCSGCTFPGLTKKLNSDRSRAVVSSYNKPLPQFLLDLSKPTDMINPDVKRRKASSASSIPTSICPNNYEQYRSTKTIGTHKAIK
jgi:hypothetical protein